MDNNVFEKLDAQGEKIDQVAEKLDGVSIDDLYALAKRTWDYQDFEMAQKYYNHISLLRPLDWKAPFCASLCGCMNSEEYSLWDRRPKEVLHYFQATVDYIQSKDVSLNEKNAQIQSAAEIVLSVLKEYVRIYAIPENKKGFDKINPAFKRELQKAFLSVIKLLEATGLDYQAFTTGLANLISDYCIKDHSIAITKEDFEKYITPQKSEIDYNAGIDNAEVDHAESLSSDQEQEIKLKGKCYLVFKDSVLEKRYRRKNTILALLLLLSMVCTTLIPLLLRTNQWFALSVLFLIPSAIFVLIRGIGNRKGIRMDSIMYHNRHKYRLQSDGNLICESIFSPVIIFGLVHFWITGMFIIISFVNSLESFPLLYLMVLLLAFATEFVCEAIIWIANRTPSLRECTKRIRYQGKWYSFDK